MSKCRVCAKGQLKRKTIKETYDYNGHTLVVKQPGSFCDYCEDGILEPKDIESTRLEIHNWQAEIDGFLAADEVKRIRRKLKLTQHQAAAFFGGGPNAFSRYERGIARPIKATDNLLRLLDKYPELLKEITSTDSSAA